MRARLGGVLVCLLLCVSAFAASAGAKETRLSLPPVGAFTEARGLAVDQGAHDIYAIDGRDEVQQIKISATAGTEKRGVS